MFGNSNKNNRSESNIGNTNNNNTSIDDIRVKNDFRKISFSGFKKTEVVKKLQDSIVNGKMEEALYWCFELVCSGHFLVLWEAIFSTMSKSIHIGNPKLAIYVEMRSNEFKSIVNNGYVDQELLLRNNEQIKTLFSEIIFIFANSHKKYEIHPIKIKEDDLSMKNINHLLKAPSIQYAKDVFRDDDPKEIFIALNEFMYNLSADAASSRNASFWFEWILLLHKVYQKKKLNLHISPRLNSSIQQKFQNDIIWIIWESIQTTAKRHSPLVQRIIGSLFQLFCLRYTAGTKTKRKMMIYYAITILCEKYDLSIPVNSETYGGLNQKLMSGVNKIYKEIKKSEKKSNTDYLFEGMKEGKSNAEKTNKKLSIMNNII